LLLLQNKTLVVRLVWLVQKVVALQLLLKNMKQI